MVHKVEASLRVKGHDFHAHSEDGNMYAAIGLLMTNWTARSSSTRKISMSMAKGL